MPKYLARGSYTTDGLRGLLKDGGSKKVQAIKELIEGVGGKLEAFYFAFGEDDFFMIIDGPDSISSIAGFLIANATGVEKTKTTVLITPEEIDKATRRTMEFQPQPPFFGQMRS